SSLLLDDDLPFHALVTAAAEHVAVELERAALRLSDVESRDMIGLDVRAKSEIRSGEPVLAIERHELHHDRLPLLEHDLRGRVLESFRGDADDARLRGGRGRVDGQSRTARLRIVITRCGAD